MIDTPTDTSAGADAMAAQFPVAVVAAQGASPRRRAARRRLALGGVRLGIVVVLLIAWQLCVNAKLVDPFFWGEPTGVWADLSTWFTVGTSQGSLGAQILVTLEEAVLGFVIGSILGGLDRVCGIASAASGCSPSCSRPSSRRRTRSRASSWGRSSRSPSASASSPR